MKTTILEKKGKDMIKTFVSGQHKKIDRSHVGLVFSESMRQFEI